MMVEYMQNIYLFIWQEDEKMFDEQLNELASIVKNNDLKEYAGDAVKHRK